MRRMTGWERCVTVLNGGQADRVPVVPQTFMFAAETAGIKVGELAHSADKMVEAQLACQTEYGYDGCVIDFDDASLAEACGAKVIFREDDPAIVDEAEVAVKELRDVAELKLPDPMRDGRLPVWLEATRLLKSRLGGRAWVMGRADQGPFSLACLLRGPQNFLMDLLDEESEPGVRALIDFCRRACAVFAKAQKAAGADATSIGDAFAGPNLISPELFRKFALEPEIRLTEEVQASGIPFSVHICGNTTGIIADMGRTGARILEVDWQLDMGVARQAVPEATVLMGNINPSDPMVFGEPAQVDAAVRDIVGATRGRGLFLSSGCALGRNTKRENMRAMMAAAEKYGRL